jgi:glucose-6-phosphate 1-dehydrogenase
MMGDATLFQRADQVEAAWSVVTPIQKAWSAEPAPPLYTYKAGTWGPKEADELVERDGREWEETHDIHDRK